jgi:cell division protease FtsH
MTYGRFLEYLEMGWVKQVDLYDNSRNAIVQASSPELGNRPQSIRVEKYLWVLHNLSKS